MFVNNSVATIIPIFFRNIKLMNYYVLKMICLICFESFEFLLHNWRQVKAKVLEGDIWVTILPFFPDYSEIIITTKRI